MKKFCVVLLAVFLIAGCGEKKTYETISDGLETPKTPERLEIIANLPDGAVTPVFTSADGAKLYEIGDYSVTVQVVAAGDFSGLVQQITGYLPEKLQIMESVQGGLKNYQAVWSAAGEGQTQVGRACFLTDGNYYYVLTAMVPESKAGELSQGALKEMFSSFRAVPSDQIISSGS